MKCNPAPKDCLGGVARQYEDTPSASVGRLAWMTTTKTLEIRPIRSHYLIRLLFINTEKHARSDES
jgi:hypothetical protein